MTLLARLHALARPYLDGTWRYPGPSDPAVYVAHPWPASVRGAAVARVADERRVDCSTLTTSLIMALYPDAPWDQQDYGDMQVYDRRRPGSPIDAVAHVGVGEAVAETAPESLHLLQAWRSLSPLSGHAVLVYDRGTGTLDVLESTSRENRRGPRWRTATPESLRAEYPAARYLARLTEPTR